MRYSAEHKEQTRAKVLAEAAKAIRAEGPHRIGVAAVMAKAGLTHGGFYAHFTSKEDLVVQAIGAMLGDAGSNFERRTADLSPSDALRAYIGFYLSRSHRDARETGCPLAALSVDLPRLTEGARNRYAEGVASLTRRLAGLLAARGVADPEPLAASVLAELVGALSLARAVPDSGQSDLILKRSRLALRARLNLETPL